MLHTLQKLADDFVAYPHSIAAFYEEERIVAVEIVHYKDLSSDEEQSTKASASSYE